MPSFSFKFVLAGLLLIGGGALVKYLVGYKDSFWLEGFYLMCIIFGWLALLFVAIAAVQPRPGVPARPSSGLRRVAGRLALGIGFLAWLVALVAGLVVLDMYSQQRIDTILATRPTAYATATVTAIRLRSSKSGTKRAALIAYPAGTGQVQQAIADQSEQYQPGQQLRVKYALEHPDMFAVVELDGTYRVVSGN